MKKENGIYHKTFYCKDFADCSDGDKIFDIFLLSDVKYYSNDRAVKWLNVKLEDISGHMYAKVWSNRIEVEYEAFKDKIVLVSGRVTYYNGKPDFSIEKMEVVRDGMFDISEIVRTLRKEKVRVYKEEILSKIAAIKSKDLREYVADILNPNVLDAMAHLPVQLKGHHSYRGALLEHTCEVTVATYHYVKSTEAVRTVKYDIDLVLAGALLHDIGSYRCYESEGYGFFVHGSDRLLGRSYATHIALHEAKNDVWINGVEIDDITYGLLMHIIDASHGEVEPTTMEAMIVRHMNQLSAEIEMYESSYVLNDLHKQDRDYTWSRGLKREITIMRREG